MYIFEQLPDYTQAPACTLQPEIKNKKNLLSARAPQEIITALEMNMFGLKGRDHRVVWTPCGVSCPDIINRVLCVC